MLRSDYLIEAYIQGTNRTAALDTYEHYLKFLRQSRGSSTGALAPSALYSCFLKRNLL